MTISTKSVLMSVCVSLGLLAFSHKVHGQQGAPPAAQPPKPAEVQWKFTDVDGNMLKAFLVAQERYVQRNPSKIGADLANYSLRLSEDENSFCVNFGPKYVKAKSESLIYHSEKTGDKVVQQAIPIGTEMMLRPAGATVRVEKGTYKVLSVIVDP